MNAHVKDLLSVHLDDALTEAQRRTVESHLSECGDCRAELEGLRRVRRLVGALPRKELPPGFLARLKSRQAPPAAAPAPWLGRLTAAPWPRAAALGLAGLAASLMFFRQVRWGLSPQTLDGDGSLAAGAPAEGELDVVSLIEERRRSSAKRQWHGVVPGGDEPTAGQAKGVLTAAAPAPARARLRADGVPMGQSAHTNETMQDFLEAEKMKLGILDVIPPGADEQAADPWSGVPDRPLDRKEAMEAMRQMTAQLTQINDQARWKRSPTVPIGMGATPLMLSARDRAQPLAEPMPAVAAARGAANADSLAFVGAPTAASAPAKRLKAERGWSGTTGGMGAAGGAVIRERAHWADLWERVRFTEKLPEVDFAKRMAVAVFAGPSPTQVRTVEISEVAEQDGQLLIRYRVSGGGDGRSSPYHIAVVPASELPYSFVQVP